MLKRVRSAARILLRGSPRAGSRGAIPAIAQDELAEIKQFFPREKFFILGHARSGTTLLMRLARLHPEVHCNYQAHFFTRRPLLTSLVDSPEVEEWLTRRSNRWNLGRDLSPLALRAVADFILERDAARQGKPIVGDKSPCSTIHGQAVRDMHAVFPDAKLVYLVRDGRDVAVSERFRNLVEESRFLDREDRKILVDLSRDPRLFADGARSIFTDRFLRRVADGWATNVRDVTAEGRRLYGTAFFVLRYEDLLARPFEEMGRLWRFLAVEHVDASLEGAIRAEIASNPDEEWQSRRGEDIASFLSKGTVGNWRRLFNNRETRLFGALAGEELRQYDYDTD
jgi:hypothetical protein